MPRDPSKEEMEEIGNAIAAGNIIRAIKLYRGITGAELRESKEFIEKLREELRLAQPGRFAVARGGQPAAQMRIFWMLWFCMFGSVIAVYIVLKSRLTAHDINPNGMVWVAGAIPVFLSIVVRWAILPRVTRYASALVCLVAGLSFADSTCFLGLILFPIHRDQLFALGLAGMLQFAPVFAGRLAR